MKRQLSDDFLKAMEEKLEHSRNKGRTGWDSKWKKASIDSFGLGDLLDKLFEEVEELVIEVETITNGEYMLRTHGIAEPADLAAVRLEAADIANVAMMIADMAGALGDDR